MRDLFPLEESGCLEEGRKKERVDGRKARKAVVEIAEMSTRAVKQPV
jgi:hypothetical protein